MAKPEKNGCVARKIENDMEEKQIITLLVVCYQYPVSYTHLDVYKRQQYYKQEGDIQLIYNHVKCITVKQTFYSCILTTRITKNYYSRLR